MSLWGGGVAGGRVALAFSLAADVQRQAGAGHRQMVGWGCRFPELGWEITPTQHTVCLLMKKLRGERVLGPRCAHQRLSGGVRAQPAQFPSHTCKSP